MVDSSRAMNSACVHKDHVRSETWINSTALFIMDITPLDRT